MCIDIYFDGYKYTSYLIQIIFTAIIVYGHKQIKKEYKEKQIEISVLTRFVLIEKTGDLITLFSYDNVYERFEFSLKNGGKIIIHYAQAQHFFKNWNSHRIFTHIQTLSIKELKWIESYNILIDEI
jgi:hypothetical protein